MNRIVRKHGKIILTILGVVLMVTFTLPTFSGTQTNPAKIVIGTLNGKKITLLERSVAGVDLAILREVGGMSVIPFLESVLDKRDPNIHWLLLIREATRYGFNSVPQWTDEQIDKAFENAPHNIDLTLQSLRVTRPDLKNALQHFEMIQLLLQFVSNLPRPISAIELLADRNLTNIQVAYATLDSAKDYKSAPEPSEDQILAQFNAYKSVLHTPIPTSTMDELPPLPAAVGGHTYPFGYKYPDRVGVEYLVFDRASLREKIKPTEEDYAEAFKYYMNHQDEYKIESILPTTAPSTAPAAVKPFAEVKGLLVDRQVEQRISRQLDRMTDRVKTQADAWRTKPEDEVIPVTDWPSFQKIADDLAKNREFDGFTPVYKSIGVKELGGGEPLGTEALAVVPGIGTATYRHGTATAPFSFPQLATSVKELAVLSKKQTIGTLGLQVGRPGPILRDSAGNVYIYRVRSVSKSHDPATLAEVRPQVVEDLKRLDTYKRLQEQAKALAADAAQKDLIALATAKAFPAVKSPVFRQIDQNLPPDLLAIRDFSKTAFSLVPSAAATQPAGTRPATGNLATTTLDEDSSLRAYVLQLLETYPAKSTDFAMKRGELVGRMDAPAALFIQSWFKLDAVMDRTHYVPDPDHPLPKAEE